MSCCNPAKKEDDHHSQKGCCQKPKPEASKGCCQPSRPASPSNQTTISPEMTIEVILGMFPNKAQKLAQEIGNAGLNCMGCHAAVWETLEAGMIKHGKTEEQTKELVERLNILLNESADEDTIAMTSRAAEKFLEILRDEGKENHGLRFAEELAGCSGYEFVLDFSEKADEDDQIFTSHGVEIHVKKAMVPRLLGSLIDYVEGLKGAGFKITNPNIRSACGCGSSHNY